MGSVNSVNGFKRNSLTTLQKSLILYNQVFYSELVSVSIVSFIIGFEIAQIIYEFRKAFIQSRAQSHLCPICQQVPFQLICTDCKHIASCQTCFQKLKGKCSFCKKEIHDTTKIYF